MLVTHEQQKQAQHGYAPPGHKTLTVLPLKPCLQQGALNCQGQPGRQAKGQGKRQRVPQQQRQLGQAHLRKSQRRDLQGLQAVNEAFRCVQAQYPLCMDRPLQTRCGKAA